MQLFIYPMKDDTYQHLAGVAEGQQWVAVLLTPWHGRGTAESLAVQVEGFKGEGKGKGCLVIGRF